MKPVNAPLNTFQFEDQDFKGFRFDLLGEFVYVVYDIVCSVFDFLGTNERCGPVKGFCVGLYGVCDRDCVHNSIADQELCGSDCLGLVIHVHVDVVFSVRSFAR